MSNQISYISLPASASKTASAMVRNSGIIPLDKDTLTVIKIPSGEEHSEEINIERRIYERFVERGGHKAIPIYHGASEHGIRLGHVHHGNVRSYLDENAADEKTRMRCAVEVAEALDFTHECGVIHGDVQGFNVLVDWRLDAKLADFAGSSFDGSPLLIATYENYEYPGPKLSHKADIFSLGSTIYELMTDSPPYAGLSEKMILSRYSKGEFPDTESLGTVGSLITKCWRVEYEECKQVVHDLKAARNAILTPSSFGDAGHSEHTPTYTTLFVATVLAAAASALITLGLSRDY